MDDFLVTACFRFISENILEIRLPNERFVCLEIMPELEEKIRGVSEIDLFLFLVDLKLYAIYNANLKQCYSAATGRESKTIDEACKEILCFILENEELANEELSVIFERAFESDLIPSDYIPPDVI